MTPTPGPWKSLEGSNICQVFGRGDEALDYEVATTVRKQSDGINGETHIANARLIALAPELYHRLDSLVEAAEAEGAKHGPACGCDFCETHSAAKKLIERVDAQKAGA